MSAAMGPVTIEVLGHDDDRIEARVNGRAVRLESHGVGASIVEVGEKAQPANARWLAVSVAGQAVELDVGEAASGQDPQAVVEALVQRYAGLFW